MQRGVLLAVAVVALVVVAGCSGGDGRGTPQSIEASASQATVGETALSEAGYAQASAEQVGVNRSGTLRISGDVQLNLGYRVNATGWRTVYAASDGRGVFSLYAVPNAKPENVAARIDPLGDRSLRTVVNGAQGAYAVESLTHEQNRTATVLGDQRTVRQYAGTATRDGTGTNVTVYVVTVEHDTDVVRGVAVVPAGTDAWPTVRTLLGGVRH